MDVAGAIRAEAARRGLTQERLADLAGVSRQTVGTAMAGTGPLLASSAQKILETLFPTMEAEKLAVLFQALCTVETKRHG